jgi:hypothetical protein
MTNANEGKRETRAFELGDGVLRFEHFSSEAVLTLSLWGDRQSEVDGFKSTWSERLSRLL